jgi:hypothetical protein
MHALLSNAIKHDYEVPMMQCNHPLSTCVPCRVHKFKLPLSVKEGFFIKPVNVTAQEYRNIGIILLHLVSGAPGCPANVQQAVYTYSRLQAAIAGRLLPVVAGVSGRDETNGLA